MKNLSKALPVFLIILFVGLACKDNFLTRFSKQYRCMVTGETEPRTAEDYIKRGNYHFDREEYQCYFDACSEAVRLDPKNAMAVSCRGSGYYFFQKDYDKAIADHTKAIALDPTKRIFYVRRGGAYEAKKLYNEALADYDKSLQLSETDLQKSYTLGSIASILYEQSKLDAALAKIEEAIKLNSSYYWHFDMRAKIYYKLGKYDLAEADAQKAKELEKGKKDRASGDGSDNAEITNSNQIIANSNQTIAPPTTVSGGVLNGKATSLPKPAYPAAAKAVRASGAVNVQVTVDEKGNVVSATAVSGHPLLRQSAESAARAAKFSPTLLSGKAVKVTGVIVYNFVP